MKRLLSGLGLLGLSSAIALACGGSDDKLAEAIEELVSTDLEVMVLTQDEWGSIASDFEIDTDSGPQDNAAAAEDSIDPDDDSDDFDDAGRETGYELTYQHSNFLEALSEGESVLSVRSEVELFETADQAKSDIERKISELGRFEDEEIEGIIVGAHTEFDVEIADHQAGGVSFSSSIPSFGFTAYSTVVYFRVDRLSAAVLIGSGSDDDVRPQAEVAARKLEERIRGVALGEIDEDPVAIPTAVPTASDGSLQPPPGVPDLSQIALALEDLPNGFAIEEEAYEAPPEMEFTRNFDVENRVSVALGRTEVVGIQNIISLFESELEARLAVSFFEAILESESAKTEFSASLAQSVGPGARVGEFRSEEIPDLGDQNVVIIGVIETSITDFVFAFTVVRVDTLVSLLNFTTLAEGFRMQDLVPLIELEARRLAGGSR